VDGKRENRSVFNNQENDFPHFIYVVALSLSLFRLLEYFCISMATLLKSMILCWLLWSFYQTVFEVLFRCYVF